MDRVILGKTGLEVNKNGFGALPVQRVEKRKRSTFCRRLFITASTILIRQGRIRTARRRWALLLST